MPYTSKKSKLKSDFIDLGEELKSGGMTISVGSDESSESPKYHYPSLYFDNVKGLEKLEKEGMAVIHYKKVMERTEDITRNGKNEKRHSVELQICGIKPECCEEMPEMEEKEDTEDAIEMGLKAAAGESEENEEKDETEEEDED
jgi:hypothetical protein